MTDKNKTTKFISAILIISMILPAVLLSIPKKADAFWGVFDTTIDAPVAVTTGTTATASTTSATANVATLALKIKDVAIAVGKELLMLVAKQILAKLTQATINWINSDFHGSPLFIENPQSFFGDIAKSEIKTLVNLYGYDPNKFPFGKQFALNVISSYQRQLADNTQYTLSNVIKDATVLDNYRNDFNVGGWNGFLINTQYPQNNYLGFNMLANEELARKLQGTVQNAAQKVQTALQQGMGFLSPQTCPSNPQYNNGINEFLKPSFKFDSAAWDKANPQSSFTDSQGEFDQAAYNAKYAEDKSGDQQAFDRMNTCPGGLVNTTPGSVAGNQIMMAMGSSFRQSELGAALGNSLSAIFDALINHFLDKGLNALSSTVNPSSSSNDNWSYDGNTLSGSTPTTATPTGIGGALNIPQNVSVVVGDTTSTIISGGTANYSIQTPPDTSVATAMIDISNSAGPKLAITGIAPGQTSVTVIDSSIPSQIVTINITVGIKGALMVSPANISTSTDKPDPIVASISGGTEPYFLQTSPNESIAIAVVSSTNLIVTGVGKGITLTRIRDSSIPQKTIDVMINVTAPDQLIINPPNISVQLGQVSSIPISGGTAPYIIMSQQDVTVATAEILPANPNIIKVTGLATGANAIMIRDSSSPFQTANAIITTLAPVGNCVITFNGSKNGNLTTTVQMPRAQCDSANGQWIQTSNP